MEGQIQQARRQAGRIRRFRLGLVSVMLVVLSSLSSSLSEILSCTLCCCRKMAVDRHRVSSSSVFRPRLTVHPIATSKNLALEAEQDLCASVITNLLLLPFLLAHDELLHGWDLVAKPLEFVLIALKRRGIDCAEHEAVLRPSEVKQAKAIHVALICRRCSHPVMVERMYPPSGS